MNFSEFNHLPDDGRLWIYGFDGALGEHARRLIAEHLDPFIRTWMSHDVPVTGAWATAHDRFVLLAGAAPGPISGCAIDGSVANFKHLREAHALNGLDRDLVFFITPRGDVEALHRDAFGLAVAEGRVGPGTSVFDTTIHTLADLRADKFCLPFEQSWHARAFSA